MEFRLALFVYFVALSSQLYIRRVKSTSVSSPSGTLMLSTGSTSISADGNSRIGDQRNTDANSPPVDWTSSRQRRSMTSAVSDMANADFDDLVDSGVPRTFLIDNGIESQSRSQRSDFRSVDLLRPRGPLRRQFSKVTAVSSTSGSGIAARSSGASDGSYVRHRFTPWGGKRGVGFQPWGGKRAGSNEPDAVIPLWSAVDIIGRGDTTDGGEARRGGWLTEESGLYGGLSAQNEATNYDVKRGFHPWGGKRRRRQSSK